MLTSAQRAQLKSLAMKLEPVVMVGKSGITENVVREVNATLTAHELIKGKVQEGSMFNAKEAVQLLAEAAGAEPVQAIGNKFVLYRENPDLPAEKRIRLKK